MKTRKVSYLIFKDNRLVAIATFPEIVWPVKALHDWVCKWDNLKNLHHYSLAIWDKRSSSRGDIEVLVKGDKYTCSGE